MELNHNIHFVADRFANLVHVPLRILKSVEAVALDGAQPVIALVADEEEAPRPRADIALKSELEFYQGFVRLKVAVKNEMDTFIMNATFELMFNEAALKPAPPQ